MNSIKALLFFMLSLIAVQLLVKTGAQIEGCGGNYTNMSGTISSPNYPSNYDTNLRCYYYIRLPTSQTSVNITFISFDTDRSGDWLQIICYRYDHSYIPNQWFGGSTLPPPLLSISSCPTVTLWFSTDGSGTRQGFSLKYDIGNAMEGGLTLKPMNSYVRSDWPTTEPTILSCSSRANQTDAYAWWSYSRDGCSFFIITASNCSVLPSIYSSDPKYFTTATQYSTRTCNLAISAQYINDAVGFYTCTDATLDFAFALVDTIDWPENTSMVINGDDNGRVVANGILTCFVPANPPVIYRWTTQEYGFPEGPTVTVSHNGTYTCTATNAIREKPYVASKSINIMITIIDSQKNEPEDKFNTVALVVGVVLGFAVLLLLVVAIVQCVLLRRKRNTSATTDANYDYIDAAISTDAGPAKDQLYELTQRERSPYVDQAGAVATSGQKDVPAMYDRLRRQTYDSEIPTGDKSQPYLQTRDIEIPVHTEDKSQPYVSLYE